MADTKPIEEIPNLETQCTACGGASQYYCSEDDCFKACEKCNGSGFVPTDFGKRVLSLVRHNAKVSFNAELCVAGS